MLHKLKAVFPLNDLRWLAALMVLGALSGGAHAADDEDEAEKAWKEIALQLPAAPQSQNLLPFYVSPTATQKFSIDSTSISVGKDGVVRYTLVSVGDGGARNVSYEGLRCDQMQKRLYAFGRPDGSWSRSRREEWEPIRVNSPNRQHITLASDFMCDGRTVAGNAVKMAQKFREFGALGAHHAAYGEN
jgi:hypothetical protein